MNVEKKVKEEFILRVFIENYPRIYKCLSLLNEEQIWESPRKEIIPIGNIILHLCGNVRQWIVHGLGNEPDKRNRKEEFKPQKNIRKADIIFLMQHIKVQVEFVLEHLNSSEFEKKRSIQGFQTDGFSIICHVMEHFSYHTGQITFLTKYHTKKETHYYNDDALNE